jgi:hypothetical protein
VANRYQLSNTHDRKEPRCVHRHRRPRQVRQKHASAAAFRASAGGRMCGRAHKISKQAPTSDNSPTQADSKHTCTTDRTTPIGKMIDSYLRSQSDLDDRAIHLLFAANRWELACVCSPHHISPVYINLNQRLCFCVDKREHCCTSLSGYYPHM